MPRKLQVHFLPSLVRPDELAGGDVIVIDVLRATTTIIYALAAGAKEVIPCVDVDQARALAEKLPRQDVLLAGERGGVLIPGFDLANSPAEFTPERVTGRTLVFTTTNGTRAMEHCRSAAEIRLAAFVNLDAVRQWVATRDNVHVLCAGTDGQITREDVLCAGAIVPDIAKPADAEALNDEARIARDAWHGGHFEELSPAEAHERLAHEMAHTLGGANLVALSLKCDLAAAAEISQVRILPRLDIAARRITAYEKAESREGGRPIMALRVTVFVCVLLAMAFGATSARRVDMFGDPVALWQDSLLYYDGRVARIELAAALENAGRTCEAIEHLRAALVMDPNNPFAHWKLGRALVFCGHPDEADQHFRSVIVYGQRLRGYLDAALAQSYYNVGVYLLRAGRMPEAIEHYQAAIDVDRDYAIAYFGMAKATGQLETARKALDLARSQANEQLVSQIEAWIAAR